jgi:hypothetical protein
MENKGDKLRMQVGNENHFTVPEGYLEGFTVEMMDVLSRMEKPVKAKEFTRWGKIRPFLYMAAMFVGAAFLIKVFSWKNNTDLPDANHTDIITQIDVEYISNEFIDEVLDMSMIDDYSLYVYLTDANIEY